MTVTIGPDQEVLGVKPKIRYIKLGQGNEWATRAIQNGEMPFSFQEVPHDLALTLDRRLPNI